MLHLNRKRAGWYYNVPFWSSMIGILCLVGLVELIVGVIEWANLSCLANQ
jgi:hypothetical protein